MNRFLLCLGEKQENAMRCDMLLSVLFLLLSLAGCATMKDTVVLVPDADGKVGQVTITTKAGSWNLSEANTVVEVSKTGKKLTDPYKIDQKKIEALFSESISALPPAPISFLLYFRLHSSELTAESKAYVPQVLSIISSMEHYEISIIGHTDTSGSDYLNMQLSADRAAAVRDLLVSHGIHSGRMELRYHGKRDPLVPTGDNVREPRNRRVEVVVK